MAHGAWARSLETRSPGTPHHLEGGRTKGLGMPSSVGFICTLGSIVEGHTAGEKPGFSEVEPPW